MKTVPKDLVGDFNRALERVNDDLMGVQTRAYERGVLDGKAAQNAELKRETEAHGLTAGVAAALNDDVKRLRDIVELARILIQPGDDGPQLEGHHSFREALMSACRKDLKTPDNIGEIAARAAGGE